MPMKGKDGKYRKPGRWKATQEERAKAKKALDILRRLAEVSREYEYSYRRGTTEQQVVHSNIRWLGPILAEVTRMVEANPNKATGAGQAQLFQFQLDLADKIEQEEA